MHEVLVEELGKPHKIHISPEERDELEARAVIKAFAQRIKDQFRESSPVLSEH